MALVCVTDTWQCGWCEGITKVVRTNIAEWELPDTWRGVSPIRDQVAWANRRLSNPKHWDYACGTCCAKYGVT